MKVGVLTSSRADFGIYLPLLRAMRTDPFFDVRLLVFGTHLSPVHGHTIDAIVTEGFLIDHRVETVLASDTPQAIATSMALTAMKFSTIWAFEKDTYDLVFCLGDRYEMFAAVSAAVPFNIPFAHVHGGETTLGAIDNQFRHCLSLFSRLHFVATEAYAQRVKELIGNGSYTYIVGALSLDNLDSVVLLTIDEFLKKFGIDLSKPTILITYHPETVAIEKNQRHAQELLKALDYFTEYQVIITMPNADTMGHALRTMYKNYAMVNERVCLVENFGTQGYFSCMKHCRLIVGNSSSGIIEAASFHKYVVDIGDRQKGRITSGNTLHATPVAESIIEACKAALSSGKYKGHNEYYRGGAVKQIIEVLKKWQP